MIPDTEIVNKSGEPDFEVLSTSTPLLNIFSPPITISLYKSGNNYFLDPTSAEQVGANCRMTIAVNEHGICGMSTTGSGGIAASRLPWMMQVVQKIGSEMLYKIQNS